MIRVGTSGALQEDIPVNSYLFSTAAIGFDGLLHHYELQHTSDEIRALEALDRHMPDIFAVRPYLTTASSTLENLFDSRTIKGTTVTCGGFYGPQGRSLRAQAKNPDFLDQLSTFEDPVYRFTNLEMETAGIYGIGRVLGFECASMNLIVVNRKQKNVSEVKESAMDEMIQYTLEKIASRGK